MSNLRANRTMATRVIHAGEASPRIDGAVSMPVFQSATFEHAPGEDMRYIGRSNTPNHVVLHDKLKDLENGEDALVMSSGSAAISTALISLLGDEGHVLVQRSLYGGTYLFLTEELPRLGGSYTFIDGDDPDSWQDALRNNTRAIYLESLGNPLIDVPDLDGAVQFARSHELVSIVDNTFASPVNYRPLEHGFDLSLHSATKYLNGHTDIVAGAVIGSAALVERIRNASRRFGGSLDPHACYLLHRGIKTLVLRVRQQNDNTLALARFLESHSRVRRVNYPGLESHPQHHRAVRWFDGCGGVLSFEIDGSAAQAGAVVRRLEMCIVAPSLGGVETLVTIPAATSHSAMSRQQRGDLGIGDNLIRVAVGIEEAADIIADFDQALAAL